MLYISLLDIYLYINRVFKLPPKFQFQLCVFTPRSRSILSLYMYCHLTILRQGYHFFIKNVGLLSSDNDQICHYFFNIIIPFKGFEYILYIK